MLAFLSAFVDFYVRWMDYFTIGKIKQDQWRLPYDRRRWIPADAFAKTSGDSAQTSKIERSASSAFDCQCPVEHSGSGNDLTTVELFVCRNISAGSITLFR